MKAKKLAVIGLTCVLVFASLTGCGAKSTHEGAQIESMQLEGEAQESFQMTDQPMTMKVEAIEGNEITAIAVMQNFEKEQKPDMQMPEGKLPVGEDGKMPERPEGDFPKEHGDGEPSFRGEMESVTFTITDETKIMKQSESETIDATADQINTDSVLQVELNENKEAIGITILTIPGAR